MNKKTKRRRRRSVKDVVARKKRATTHTRHFRPGMYTGHVVDRIALKRKEIKKYDKTKGQELENFSRENDVKKAKRRPTSMTRNKKENRQN